MSSLCRGHANLLCIVPIFSYVTPKGTLVVLAFFGDGYRVLYFGQSAGALRNIFYVSGTQKPVSNGPYIWRRLCAFLETKNVVGDKVTGGKLVGHLLLILGRYIADSLDD